MAVSAPARWEPHVERVVILGAGGHAASVAETVVASGGEVVAFVSHDARQASMLGAPVIARIPTESERSGLTFVVAVGDNASRERVTRDLVTEIGWEALATLVHPSASVSSFARVGPGSVVLQGAVVGSRTVVGAGCIVNSRASLDHDCSMLDFSSLAPGATTGGQVRIGVRSAVGIGAVVKHGVTIGDDTVIGAASYVHRDVDRLTVAYGTPAVAVRSRQPSDPYLG